MGVRNGQLELFDPVDIEEGQQVEIAILSSHQPNADSSTWTDEEVEAMINISPMLGSDIVKN